MATKTMDQLFEVYDVIGTGAFANVRRVRRKEDGRLLVLKTLRARVDALSDEERRDMINEVDLLSELNHPNVIQYFGSFVENSNQHIVMEYAAGGALVNVLNQARGPLPEDQIWEWFSQMCIALRYVHNCNILHRDIKPQNILLWGPRGRVVKLADFGIAKVLSNSSPAGAQLVGTPYYLAPEICSGGVYTQKSDVWALACVLYEMLSLSKPFQSPNLPQLALQIIREPHQPLNSIALRTYSDAIRDLINLMLQKDSDDRPDMHQLCAIPVVRHKMQLWDAIRDTLIQTEAREVQQEADTYILSRRENKHNEQGAGPNASDSSQAYACTALNARGQGSAAQAATSPCTGSTSASETTDPSGPSSGTPYLPSEAHAESSNNNVLLKCSIDTSGPESALATTFASPTNSSRSGSPRRINRNVQKMSVLEQNAVFRRNSGGASAAASAGDALSPRSHAEPDGGGAQCVRTFFSTGSPRAAPGPGQLGTLSLGGSFSRFRSSTGIGSGLNESRDSGMSFSSMSDSEARIIMSLFIRDGVRVFRWGSGQRRPKLDERIYLASMQHNEWVNVESIACTQFEEEESETHHTLVLTEDGQVLSLGCNSSGQLGISPSSLDIAALRQLRHIRYFSDRSICIASVACGSAFSAAVSRDGKVYMWGDLSDLGDHSELELKFEACGDLAQDSVFAEGMSEASSLVSEVNDGLRYGNQSSRPKAALTVDTGSSRSRMSLLSSDDEGSVRRGPSASSLGMSLLNVSSRSKTGRSFFAEGNPGEDGLEEDYVRRGRSTSTLSVSSFNLAISTANGNVSKRMLQTDEDTEDSVSRGPSASTLGMASLNVSSRASNLKAAMPRSSQLGQMDSLSPERTNDGSDQHQDEVGSASPPQGWPAWAKEQFYRNQSKPPGENPFRSPRHGDAETPLFFGNSMSLSTTSSSFASTTGISDDKRMIQVQNSFSDQGFLIDEVEEDDEDEEAEGDTEEEEEEKLPEPHSAPLGIVRNLTQSLRNMGKSPRNRLASAATTTSAPERWRGLFRPNSFSSILSKSSRSLLRRRSSSSSMASQNSNAADVEQKEHNVDDEHQESTPPLEPIRVGKRVHLVSKRLADCGVVRFMGRTGFARGIWVGIELDEPLGKNDGTVKGKRYFTCAESHGVFVQPQNVLVVARSGEVPAWELFEHPKESRSQLNRATNRRGSSRSYGNGQSGAEEDYDAAADGQSTFDPLYQSSRSSRSGEESTANQVLTTLSLSSAEDVTVRRTQSNEDSQYVVEDHVMSPDGTVTEPRWVHALSTSFAIEVACGTNFACVLTREGRLFTWGQNDFGQLGLGHDDEQAHPTMVDLGAESVVKSMAVGEAHVLVITGSNNLYAWGRGCEGQLGLDREIYDEPNADPSLVDAFPGKALSIAAGRYHSAGVTDDGEVYTWGEGDSGQLGLGDLESQRVPTLVTSLGRNGADVKVVQVTCGAAHTVALTETRAVYVWGNDQRGANPKLLPQNVDALSGSSVRDLCCGSFETYALCRLENPQDGL